MSNIIPESEVIPILLFIVPGFISLSIRRSLQPTQNAGEWDKIINCFIYSLVILFFLSLVGISADQLIIWSWIGAIVFGILLTVMDIFKPYMFDFFRYIHLTDFSGRQSIWDDAFPQTNKTYWIRAEVSDDLAYLGVLKSQDSAQKVFNNHYFLAMLLGIVPYLGTLVMEASQTQVKSPGRGVNLRVKAY